MLVFVAVGLLAAKFLHPENATQGAVAAPAGFGRGVWHGAIMPFALPKLLAGQNVAIYAVSNTGRTYNLGYITGINLCGLIFFGLLFRTLYRRRVASRGERNGGGAGGRCR